MDRQVLEVVEYNGCKVRIVLDADCDSPRTWTNLGILLCRHRKYALGDAWPFECASNSLDDIAKKAVAYYGPSMVFRVRAYDHSGLALHAYGMEEVPYGQMADPWDSGWIGIMVIPHQAIREWYGVSRVTKRYRERAKKIARQELADYETWINGGAIGYMIEDANGKVLDSCYGYLDREYAIESAKKDIIAHTIAV